MRCESCGKDVPNPRDGRHRRYCVGEEASSYRRMTPGELLKQPVARLSVTPIDLLAARMAATETTIKALGKQMPALPNGLLLTSPMAKSFLTQFIMNLEATKKFAQSMLDLIDEQEREDVVRSLRR